MGEGVVNRGRGSFDGRSVMSSKRVFEVFLDGMLLDSGLIHLYNRSSRVRVIASSFIRRVSVG